MPWDFVQNYPVGAGDLAEARLSLGNQYEHAIIDEFLDALVRLPHADASGSRYPTLDDLAVLL